jgi:hypothetical protein
MKAKHLNILMHFWLHTWTMYRNIVILRNHWICDQNLFGHAASFGGGEALCINLNEKNGWMDVAMEVRCKGCMYVVICVWFIIFRLGENTFFVITNLLNHPMYNKLMSIHYKLTFFYVFSCFEHVVAQQHTYALTIGYCQCCIGILKRTWYQ